MAAIHIGQCHDIEQKRLHVVVEGLVVQKELGQQAEMLAILLVPLPIHLPHLQLTLAVDLIPRWMPPDAFLRMPLDARLRFLVAQTKLTDIHLGQAGSIVRIGGLIPHLHLVLAHADISEIRGLGDM